MSDSGLAPGSRIGRFLAGVAVSVLAGTALAPGARAAVPAAPQAPTQQDTTPHSDARLIAETAAVTPGQPFTVGLHITLDEGWHTYWKNAGDAGNGVIIDWSLPDGFAVDSLRYPVPERIPYPPLMSYGYHDEVVMLATVTPPADLAAERVSLAADADFLVCEEVCIPAHTRVSLELPVGRDSGEPGPSADAALIGRFRDRLPGPAGTWAVRAARTEAGFVLGARPPEEWEGQLDGAYFFPESPVILDHTAEQTLALTDGELRVRLTESPYLPDEPDSIRGILTLPEGRSFDRAGHRAIEIAAPLEREAVAWASESGAPLAPADPGEPVGVGVAAASRPAAPPASAGLSLFVAIAFALVGGLILNLMPCVFPILSLKALGFANRGGDRQGMRRDGLAFGAGVVLTFLVVAGILMAVRAGGAEVGWGYQLQSPTIVALLAALMFGIGLWLAGVVELGASLTRLGGFGEGEGQRSSFLTGVLATVVATPCTAPFMGAAIGAAMLRPPVEALAIFLGLGLGMAAPYVVLSFWPALAARLPRPGRWMETFKQALAFPMFAVAVWLVWVFGLQVGIGGAARLLFGLLLLAVAAWLIGRWPAPPVAGRVRVVTRALAIAATALAVLAAAAAIRGAEPLPGGPDGRGAALDWEPYTAETVATYRQAGRPVFVDFTAAWCISCQVNERVALESGAVRAAFRDRDVALLRADWTRRDPVITRALASFGRVGVPLYVLYPADPIAEPRVLPELLTPAIVLDALREVTGDVPDGRQAREN